MESVSFLAKVLWSPAETMLRVANRPRILTPLIFLTIGSLIYVSVMFRYLDLGEMSLRMREQRAGTPQMSAEQRDQALRMLNSPAVKAFGVVGGLLGPTMTVVMISLVYFGLLTLVGRDGGFKAFVAITAFAFVPSVFRTIAAVLTMVIVPSSQMMLDELGNIGPALMVDRAGMSPKLFAAVAQIDIVSIWVLVLLVIGYRFTVPKKVGTPTIAASVFGVWLLYVAFRAGVA